MRDDFALYILSHNRASKVSTLTMLKQCNYTGKWFIVIDDEDDVAEYTRLYGKENILVFNKDIYMDTKIYEPIDNLHKKGCAFPARNFINEHARSSGLRFFAQFDDDIQELLFRYVDETGKFKRAKCYNIDKVLEEFIRFMECSDTISGTCFTIDSAYFGGKDGKFKDGMGRRIYQTMILKVSNQVPWVGSYSEDFLLSMLNIDKLYFEVYSISFVSPQMSTNRGGIDYSSLFDARVYLKVALGEKLSLTPSGSLVQKNNNLFPKIISSRFKV